VAQAHGGVLRPFVRGESGNPGGRPREGLISRALRVLLSGAGPGRRSGSLAESLAATLTKHATAGNLHALREILGRTEGRWPTAASMAESGDFIFVTLAPRPVYEGQRRAFLCPHCVREITEAWEQVVGADEAAPHRQKRGVAVVDSAEQAERKHAADVERYGEPDAEP